MPPEDSGMRWLGGWSCQSRYGRSSFQQFVKRRLSGRYRFSTVISKAQSSEYRLDIISSMVELDDINIELIDLLQTDGRMSFRELGERVGLSAPAVTERVRKLEEIGRHHRLPRCGRLRAHRLSAVVRRAPELASRVDRGRHRHRRHARSDRGAARHRLGIPRDPCRVRDTYHLEDMLHGLWEHGDSVTNIATSHRCRTDRSTFGGSSPAATAREPDAVAQRARQHLCHDISTKPIVLLLRCSAWPTSTSSSAGSAQCRSITS